MSVLQVFDRATAPDERSHLEFVKAIPTILSSFSGEWVQNRFIPFLVTWLPTNSLAVVSSFLDVLPAVVDSAGSLLPAASLFELILAADVASTAATLTKVVAGAASDPSLLSFVSYVAQSPYDAVRKFAPSVLRHLKSDEERLTIIHLLISTDTPFKVRYAVVRAIPTLSDALALQVGTALQGDPAGKIRAALPVVLSSRTFWLGSLAAKFASDHDWSVRASLASALVQSASTDAAIVLGVNLLSDGVWQVKLCALRSLTVLLDRLAPGAEVPALEGIRRMLAEIRLRYQIPTLKKAVTDVFLAIYSRQPHPDDKAMVLDLTSKEDPEVQLHFLTHAVAAKSSSLIGMIAGQLVPIVNKLTASELWRNRLGTVDLLTDLIALSGNVKIKSDFSELCQRLITDESWDVREAAVRQLINLDNMSFVDGQLPVTIVELGKSGTFRKRQAALLIIKHLSQKGIGNQEKLLLKAELGKYVAPSECPNIMSLATEILAQFPE